MSFFYYLLDRQSKTIADTVTPAQELLEGQRRDEILGIMSLKVRSFVRKALLVESNFLNKMRLYLREKDGNSSFCDNRLRVTKGGGTWMFVDPTRQCSCCGQILAINSIKGKLLSCGTCKTTHYCDRACQKRHWKNGHKSVCRPAEGKQGMEVVLHTCVRVLSLMSLTQIVSIGEMMEDGQEILEVVCPDVVSSIFLPKEDARSKKYVDLANDRYPKGKDRVCNHFREKQESNRILFLIWEAATDNLAFVLISLDFLSNGLGVEDALIKSFETDMSTNRDMYFVVAMGMVKGKLAVVRCSSFIAIPYMAQKPCQEGQRAK